MGCEKASPDLTGIAQSSSVLSSSSEIRDSATSSVDNHSVRVDELSGVVEMTEITPYLNEDGEPDGSYMLSAVIPNGTDINLMQFEITNGYGYWQLAEPYLSQDQNAMRYYTNWFVPACNGDYKVMFFYSQANIQTSKTVYGVVSEDDLPNCSELGGAELLVPEEDEFSFRDVPVVNLPALHLVDRASGSNNSIDLDTWTTYDVNEDALTSHGAEIDLVLDYSEGLLKFYTGSGAKQNNIGLWGPNTSNSDAAIFEVDVDSVEFAAVNSALDVIAYEFWDDHESLEVQPGSTFLLFTSLEELDTYLIRVESLKISNGSVSLSLQGKMADQPE